MIWEMLAWDLSFTLVLQSQIVSFNKLYWGLKTFNFDTQYFIWMGIRVHI